MNPKSIVILSDIHCGSWKAVSPPKATINRGKESSVQSYNAIGKALYKAWHEVATDWEEPDVLVINGEPVDGPNRYNPSDVWSTSLLDQMTASRELIREFKAKKIYTTRGSDYHVTIEDQPFEEYYGHGIGAEKIDGAYAPDEFTLKINDVWINFSHPIATTRMWQYRSSAISSVMAQMKLNQSHRWPADIIVRSHVHYYWYVGSASHLGIITPCWKITDHFAYKIGSGASAPDIGAVRLIIEDDGTFHHEAKLFKLKEFKPPLVSV